jgi:hypothetical protein
MPVVRRTSTEWEKPWRTRIFATRALPQGQKIIVGWEWDDANAMHRGIEVAGRERCMSSLFFSSFPSLPLLSVLCVSYLL